MPKKDPWIAAILNFLFNGAGYLYVGGKRTTFGILLLVAWIVSLIGFLIFYPVLVRFSIFLLPEAIAGFILIIALAYDGYKYAKEK